MTPPSPSGSGGDASSAGTTSGQGTVWAFDAAASEGQVVLDDGTRIPFGADAFVAGGLRQLRPGQRVRLELVDGVVRRVTILTLR